MFVRRLPRRYLNDGIEPPEELVLPDAISAFLISFKPVAPAEII